MPFNQIILIIILTLATLFYAQRWIAPEATSIVSIAALMLAGLLDYKDGLSGFASSATLTVAAMFVLSAGLVRTGALEAVTIYLARASGGNRTRLLLLLGLSVPIASAFINNTPVVVMLVPMIITLSAQFDTKPSKFLIPLSYFAILGGSMTLIGTSTNILIDELYRQAGGPGFDVFEFAPLGVAFTAVGLIFVLLFSDRLLPDRAPLVSLLDGGPRTTYVTEVVVTESSALVGKTARESFGHLTLSAPVSGPVSRPTHRRLRPLSRKRLPNPQQPAADSVQLLQFVRQGAIFRAHEAADQRLQVNDTLLISAAPREMNGFIASTGVRRATVLEDDHRVEVDEAQLSATQSVVEAVVLPDSAFQHQRLRDLGLSRDFGVQVLGVQRRGRHQLIRLRTLTLTAGDVLLLRGSASGLQRAAHMGHLLMVEGVDRSIPRSTRNRHAILIMLAVVLLATLTSIPIVVWALMGAAFMVITQCLSIDDAFGALDANTLLLLAAAIPMGKAMETSGLAQSAVDLMVNLIGPAQPIVFLSAFYLLANVLAQFISVKAVAVLFVPIALNLALTLQINPTAMIMAIAFGVNASLITPIGHPVNTIVMGPGGYRFGDYVRLGLPLMILLWITATITIPLIWPL